ncbi:MAG: nitroreductase family protein [Acidimicrobiales bacterium]
MEFQDVVRRRKMVRSFEDRPLVPGVLDRVLDNARRGPSAGFAQGVAFVALEGPAETAVFWDHTLPAAERDGFRWRGLLRAPVVVLCLADRETYVRRYGEPDKAGAKWPVQWWDIDCAFATMLVLLTAVDAEVGASFFGIPRGEVELLAALGVPPGHRTIGAVALGHPAADDRPSTSVARRRRPAAETVHRGRW